MKILQIYELDPMNRIGGIEVAVFELSRHLAAMGHDVTVISGADNTCRDSIRDGVRYINIDLCGIVKSSKSRGGLSLARQAAFLPTLLLRNPGGFDVYHGHLYTSGIAAAILAGRHSAVSVNTIHGSYYPAWRLLTGPARAAFCRTAERILAPAAAGMAGLQIHTGMYFARQVLDWGCDPEKIRVIYNGVNLDKFNPQAEAVPYECDLPLLLTARRLVKKNGVDRLLNAMPGILEETPCKLLVAGDGPELMPLKRLCVKLGIEKSVVFQGAVPHDRIAGYIARADIAVVPSIVEASSIFMLEAMAEGKPVVATTAWGLEEILDGENGIITDARNLGDTISSLLGDERKMRDIGRAASRYAFEKHSWEHVARRTESEYHRLLGTRD